MMSKKNNEQKPVPIRGVPGGYESDTHFLIVLILFIAALIVLAINL